MKPHAVASRSIVEVSCNPKELSPFPTNARVHSKKQIRQIKRSIATFGFIASVIIDEAKVILAGHARVIAAVELGLQSVPCRCVSGLSLLEKKALVLADNKIASNAQWDNTILASELETLILADTPFDIEVLGFDPFEIDMLIDGENPGSSNPLSGDEEHDPAADGPAITKNGDLWICGDHRIICGDSLKAETYEKLLGDERAQMVFNDPPYNLRIEGHVSGLGKVKHDEFAMASGEMTPEAFTAFLHTMCLRLSEYSVNGSIHFICMDWRHVSELSSVGKAVFSELKNIIVWAKDNAGMGSFYRSKHELIAVFKNGTAPHANNFGLGNNGRYRTNVWEYKGMNSRGKGRMEALQAHPTAKPVAMIADAMRDCSTRGGIVLDPFSGSGSTMIAGEQTKRRTRLIEIKPTYVDQTVRRWQKIAKDDAIHAVTGETFASRELAIRNAATTQIKPAAADIDGAVQ